MKQTTETTPRLMLPLQLGFSMMAAAVATT
jgi:hypothetical protein